MQTETQRREKTPQSLANFDTLPDSAMVNVKTVAGLLGRSQSSIWRDAKQGNIPKPVKTGPYSTRWQVGALRRHMSSLG